MKNFSKACSEMNFILNNMDQNFSNKISDKFKRFFLDNKSDDYVVNLKVDKPLYQQKLLEETEIYLQIAYKLFIAPPKEKEEYIAKSRRMFVQENIKKHKKTYERT